jgi:hypothetical protein
MYRELGFSESLETLTNVQQELMPGKFKGVELPLFGDSLLSAIAILIVGQLSFFPAAPVFTSIPQTVLWGFFYPGYTYSTSSHKNATLPRSATSLLLTVPEKNLSQLASLWCWHVSTLLLQMLSCYLMY